MSSRQRNSASKDGNDSSDDKEDMDTSMQPDTPKATRKSARKTRTISWMSIMSQGIKEEPRMESKVKKESRANSDTRSEKQGHFQDAYYELYTIGRGGRGRLVDSLGYTYNVMRIYKNGSVWWQCSQRSVYNKCGARVREKYPGQYDRIGPLHTHEGKPDAMQKLKVVARALSLAMEDQDMLPMDVVKQVMQESNCRLPQGMNASVLAKRVKRHRRVEQEKLLSRQFMEKCEEDPGINNFEDDACEQLDETAEDMDQPSPDTSTDFATNDASDAVDETECMMGSEALREESWADNSSTPNETNFPETHYEVFTIGRGGHARLVDSLGYTYNISRRTKNGGVWWQCSTRSQYLKCSARVSELIPGQYARHGPLHSHEGTAEVLEKFQFLAKAISLGKANPHMSAQKVALQVEQEANSKLPRGINLGMLVQRINRSRRKGYLKHRFPQLKEKCKSEDEAENSTFEDETDFSKVMSGAMALGTRQHLLHPLKDELENISANSEEASLQVNGVEDSNLATCGVPEGTVVGGHHLLDGKFLDSVEILELIHNFIPLKTIPQGVKNNVAFVIDNSANFNRRQNGQLWSTFDDDCGAWTQGSCSEEYYVVKDDDSLKKMECFDGVFGVIKKSQNKAEDFLEPFNPQPDPLRLISLTRYRSKLKCDRSYERRITFQGCDDAPRVFVVEYKGFHPGPRAFETRSYLRKVLKSKQKEQRKLSSAL